jgi:hypothetical protein
MVSRLNIYQLFPPATIRLPRAGGKYQDLPWYLVGMVGALGDDLPPLAGHEVEQLVDEEGGGKGLDPAPRDGDQLATYGTPELRVACKCGHNPAHSYTSQFNSSAEQHYAAHESSTEQNTGKTT